MAKTGMTLRRVVDHLQALAPEHLAEAWDKVGLQVGDPERPMATALLCIDLTEAVLDEAISQKASLIVAYHPPIFEPLTALTTDHWKQRVLMRAIEHRIAIYSPHTALDAAEGGVNDWLAEGLGAGWHTPLRRTGAAPAQRYKLVTFVPPAAVDALRAALSAAGAGQIGAYSQCSFVISGEGTFLGGEGARPVVGKAGRLERVNESRLEMIFPYDRVTKVIDALRRAHPYEEPAFDVYPLSDTDSTISTGQGRCLVYDAPITAGELLKRAKKLLGHKQLEVATPGLGRLVGMVGVCPGAGGSLFADFDQVFDAVVTGEMRHHDVLNLLQQGCTVILAGHTQTERPYLKVYRQRLAKRTGRALRWLVSRADKSPTAMR